MLTVSILSPVSAHAQVPDFSFKPVPVNSALPETEHFAFKAMDRGVNAKLLGDVEIILVYVSTPNHPWTSEQKDAVRKVSFSSVDIMMAEAKRYGADLNLSFGGLDFTIPYEYDADLTWYFYILNNIFHVDSIVDICEYYEKSLDKDGTPIIFLFNSWDISYSYSSNEDYPEWNEELCVIFCDTDMHDNYLTHELLHQYGAIDLYDYNKEGVEAVAKKYFPNSDMLTVSHEIDPLNAYLVGWTDSLTDDAIYFLNETWVRGK